MESTGGGGKDGMAVEGWSEHAEVDVRNLVLQETICLIFEVCQNFYNSKDCSCSARAGLFQWVGEVQQGICGRVSVGGSSVREWSGQMMKE